MNVAQIVALGIRLFCIWLAIYLLGRIPAVVFRYMQDGLGQLFMFDILVFILLMTVTIALWRFPLSIARKLLPETTLDQPIPLPLEQVQSAGFCLLGLWLLTEAIPQVSYMAVLVYYATRPNPMIAFDPYNYATTVHMLVEFGLGLWLLLGAKGLLKVLRWARQAGTGEPSENASGR